MATAELVNFVRYGKKIAGAGLNYRYAGFRTHYCCNSNLNICNYKLWQGIS
jgi:hypothetical protein